MLEEEIKTSDIGSWYIRRNGQYCQLVDICDTHVVGLTFGRVFKYKFQCDFFEITLDKWGSYIGKEYPHNMDVIRKLDPIEVNLLRLNRVRK